MSSDFLVSTLPLLGVFAITDVLALYAAYFGISVWRGLAVPIYKSRALWTAVFAALVGLAAPLIGNVQAIVPEEFYSLAYVLVYVILTPVALVVIFAFIDRTISTIIRLDYLRRDVMGWRRFRLLYWASVAVQFIMLALDYGNPAAGPYFVLYTAILLVPLLYGSVSIVIGSRRTLDMTFRSHAKWFGYCVGFIVFVAAVPIFTTDIVLDSLPFIPLSYSLYEMARHLVPVTRLIPI